MPFLLRLLSGAAIPAKDILHFFSLRDLQLFIRFHIVKAGFLIL